MSEDYRRWTKKEAERVRSHAQMILDQQQDIHALCKMWPHVGAHAASLGIISEARTLLGAAEHCLWELRVSGANHGGVLYAAE